MIMLHESGKRIFRLFYIGPQTSIKGFPALS